uniref:Uncharacterized protein n=1 Tax=Anopheles atroparvus TaxID=41427 RepID=A0A182JAF8_ANOAO
MSTELVKRACRNGPSFVASYRSLCLRCNEDLLELGKRKDVLTTGERQYDDWDVGQLSTARAFRGLLDQPPSVAQPGTLAQKPLEQLVPPRQLPVQVHTQPLPGVTDVLAFQEQPAAWNEQALRASAGHDRAVLVTLAQPEHGPTPKGSDVQKVVHDAALRRRRLQSERQ